MNFKLVFSAFIAITVIACAKESEMMTTGGYKYQVYKGGEASVKPAEGDYVFFHVDLLADDEMQFDTREQGQESAIQLTKEAEGNLINKAMNECLAKASPGDSIILYIPMDSLRNSGMPAPEETKMLAYRVKVTEILDEEGYTAKLQATRAEEEKKAAAIREQLPAIETFVQETYKYIVSGKGSNDIQSTPTGLQYIIHEKGEGDQLQPGETVTVQYYGILKENGSMFDNSWRRGSTFQFQLGAGQVIPGWDEGVALLNKGDKATLIIPSELGYGASGIPPTIPQNADLIFYIEVPNE